MYMLHRDCSSRISCIVTIKIPVKDDIVVETEPRIKVEKVFEKVEKFSKFKNFYTHTKMAGRTRG